MMSVPMLPNFQIPTLEVDLQQLGASEGFSRAALFEPPTPVPPACGQAGSPGELRSGQQTPVGGGVPKLMEQGLMLKLRSMQEKRDKQEKQVAEDDLQTPRQDHSSDKFYHLFSPARGLGLPHEDRPPRHLGLFGQFPPVDGSSRDDELPTQRYPGILLRQFSPMELSPPEGCLSNLGVDLPLQLHSRQYTPTNLGSFGGLSGFGGQSGFGAVPKPAPVAKEAPRSNKETAVILENELNFKDSKQVVSIGSLGHPFTCKEACKYRKRKSGCLMGASCTKCHLCHWRSQRAQAAQQQREVLAPPDAAAEVPPPPVPEVPRPMRLLPTGKDQPAYVSIEGFYTGAANAMVAPFADAVHPAAASAEETADKGYAGTADCPTVGSVNHPHSCNWPCKYHSKSRGCKQGASCPRCHLCRWTRSQEHLKQKSESTWFA